MKKYLLAILLTLSNGHAFADMQLNEATYKYDAKVHELENFGVINKQGYVTLSSKTINDFVIKTKHTDWLGVGIRSFTPYKKIMTGGHGKFLEQNIKDCILLEYIGEYAIFQVGIDVDGLL